MIGLIFNFSRRISAPEGQTFCLLMTVTAPEPAALPNKLLVDIVGWMKVGFPGGSVVKNPPDKQETWVPSWVRSPG